MEQEPWMVELFAQLLYRDHYPDVAWVSAPEPEKDEYRDFVEGLIWQRAHGEGQELVGAP